MIRRVKSSINLVKENMEMIAHGIVFGKGKKSFFQEGRAIENNFTEQDADSGQLRRGIEVEMEHTSDPDIAKKIALDHLSEISNYYTLLDRMESEAKDKMNDY